MPEQFYGFLLIIDGDTGQDKGRFALKVRWLKAFLLLTFLALLAWGWALWKLPRLNHEISEIETLKKENSTLQKILKTSQDALPELQALLLDTESDFSHLWQQSGMDRTRPTLSLRDTPLQNSFETLESQFEQVHIDALEVQHHLANTLEALRNSQQRLAFTPSRRPTESNFTTSSFGKRLDPFTHHWVMHKGLDLGGYTGMPVWAPANGTVIWTGWRGGYGQTVVLDHGHGLQTHYGHLSKWVVHIGQKIRRGQVIAHMGSTGHSTGPHLHYEVRYFGQPLDPTRFILDS